MYLFKIFKFFQRPESYYTEMSFAKFTGDTFKIPSTSSTTTTTTTASQQQHDKVRHHTASSTSTEYAQILTCLSSEELNNCPEKQSSQDKNDFISGELDCMLLKLL